MQGNILTLELEVPKDYFDSKKLDPTIDHPYLKCRQVVFALEDVVTKIKGFNSIEVCIKESKKHFNARLKALNASLDRARERFAVKENEAPDPNKSKGVESANQAPEVQSVSH